MVNRVAGQKVKSYTSNFLLRFTLAFWMYFRGYAWESATSTRKSHHANDFPQKTANHGNNSDRLEGKECKASETLKDRCEIVRLENFKTLIKL
jgi:hypothetical protein